MISKIRKMDVTGLVELLSIRDFSEIYNLANQVNFENHGDIIDLRAILEFSNICSRHCIYCGLNSRNKDVFRYRMPKDEIIKTAIEANQAGYKTLVLQSGEDSYFSAKKIGELVREIKTNTKDMAITISCGEKSFEEYAYIRECGANRYLLKHETSDYEIYSLLHDCGTLSNRIRCLKDIKKLGYETGSGFMIGLPNQSLETIAHDVLLLKELKCDMAGIGPFIPCPGTPLEDLEAGSVELTKRAVALTRILLPKANLPVTTSLGILDKEEKSIFSWGANIMMRKVTPQKYEEYYKIYPNDITVDNIKEQRIELENKIRKMGKVPR